MLKVTQKGSFKYTERYFMKASRIENLKRICEEYAKKGVEALRDATPVKTGLTAASWYYEIKTTNRGITVSWRNRNVNKNWANVAILLDEGHGTRNGGYVKALNYIGPTLDPIIEGFKDEVWKEVTP